MTTTNSESGVIQRSQELLGQATAAATVAMIVLGDRLGLYQALRDLGPTTAERLADTTDHHERLLREWLSQQASAGILTHDPAAGTFELPPDWAIVLTDSGMIGACLTPAGMFRDLDAVSGAFAAGTGIAWGDHDAVAFEANERFWAAQYRDHLVSRWIPAVPAVAEALTNGATVADVGAGRGAALVQLAAAFPRSRFVGFDSHAPSVEIARSRAAAADVGGRVTFEVSTCDDYPGRYDLVTFFDAFHDLGDPVGAAAHARNALNRGGSVLLVEPRAEDGLAANLANPAAPIGYAASTFLCTPSSLAQPVGTALGGQAGELRLAAVLAEAGFTQTSRVAESPFNIVLHARP